MQETSVAIKKNSKAKKIMILKSFRLKNPTARKLKTPGPNFLSGAPLLGKFDNLLSQEIFVATL